MVQQPKSHRTLPTEFDHHVVLFPTRSAVHLQTELPPRSPGRPATDRPARIRTHVIRQVAVVEVTGRLSDVSDDLDRAIQLALADGPRGVVCDLSAVSEGADPVAVEVLATAGRHVRDWPGIPVAVASADPRVREGLRAQPLGEHLTLSTSLFSAVSAVLATPVVTAQWLRLAPHPTAPRASRNFLTRTLLDWRLGRLLPYATLVISELVASSSVDAGTDIDLSVAWNLEALRLTVRDHGPALPGQRASDLKLHGRRLTLVAGLSRAFGVLPTADGGKVAWAVLDASRPSPTSGPHDSAMARQEALILDHARSLADLSLRGSGADPTADVTPPRRRRDLTLVR